MTSPYQDPSSSESDVPPKFLQPRSSRSGRSPAGPEPANLNGDDLQQSLIPTRAERTKERIRRFCSIPTSCVLMMDNAVMWGGVIGASIVMTFFITTLVLQWDVLVGDDGVDTAVWLLVALVLSSLLWMGAGIWTRVSILGRGTRFNMIGHFLAMLPFWSLTLVFLTWIWYRSAVLANEGDYYAKCVKMWFFQWLPLITIVIIVLNGWSQLMLAIIIFYEDFYKPHDDDFFAFAPTTANQRLLRQAAPPARSQSQAYAQQSGQDNLSDLASSLSGLDSQREHLAPLTGSEDSGTAVFNEVLVGPGLDAIYVGLMVGMFASVLWFACAAWTRETIKKKGTRLNVISHLVRILAILLTLMMGASQIIIGVILFRLDFLSPHADDELAVGLLQEAEAGPRGSLSSTRMGGGSGGEQGNDGRLESELGSDEVPEELGSVARERKLNRSGRRSKDDHDEERSMGRKQKEEGRRS
ncbi:hypothetical protein MNV49_002852 [Pseudohyphozyma bogoriensis]|nr:hypothetical protein MNV49_002852 [Pseudohyphozyma bogoriensis]